MQKFYKHNLKIILLFLLVFAALYSSMATEYYSTGSFDATSLGSWTNCRCGIGISPSNFSGNDTFTIQFGHVMYTGSIWNINGTNAMLRIENGATLKSPNYITLKTTGIFNIKNGGTYLHMNNVLASSTIFNGNEVFETRSNVEILDWDNAESPITVAVFGNLKILYENRGIWNQNNNIAQIKGNFILDNHSSNPFQFAANADYTLIVGKNFIIKSGLFNFAGNYSKAYALRLQGGFIQTGGRIGIAPMGGPSGNWTVVFTGDSSFYYKRGGAANASVRNYEVISTASLHMGSRLQLGNSSNVQVYGKIYMDTMQIFGRGNFILHPNSYIFIGSDSGISAPLSNKGNIATRNKSFSTGAHYIYYGKNSQHSGLGLPIEVKYLKIMLPSINFKLVMNKSVLVTDTLVLQSGILFTDTFNIKLGVDAANPGILQRTNAHINGTFIRFFANTTNSGISGLMPVGTESIYRPQQFEFTTAPLSGGFIRSKFVSSAPGHGGLPLTDGGIDLLYSSSTGYWDNAIVSGNFTNGIYDATICPNFFPDITDPYVLHLIIRTSGANWRLNGTHITSYGTLTEPMVKRIGMNSFGQIGLSGSNSFTPLPVSWNNFSVQLINEDVKLEWSTNIEINNHHFEIERSIDGIHFEKISEMEGAGNSSELNEYYYTDSNAAKLNSNYLYYRIKQIDNDLRYAYSTIQVVKLNSIYQVSSLRVFPNPCSHYIQIESVKDIEQLRIFNENGQLVVTNTPKSTSFIIDIQPIEASKLIVHLQYKDGTVQSEKIIKF